MFIKLKTNLLFKITGFKDPPCPTFTILSLDVLEINLIHIFVVILSH
jgi:hypothetical protein